MSMRRTRIMIAYDDSSGSETALRHLRRAGLPQEAEALVISVANVWNYEAVEAASSERVPTAALIARELALRAVEEARALAEQAGKMIQANFPAWVVRAEACSGSPAWELIKKGSEWEADLIILGSKERSAVEGSIFGSVSQLVVSEAQCSVRVARGRVKEDDSPVRIIIGVDGSPGAEAAVRAVAGRLWPPGAEVRMIAALEPMMATVERPGAENSKDPWDWVRKMVEVSASQLRAAGLTVSSLVEDGDPKRALLEEAEQWDADCIFVGARGLRSIEQLPLSSVSAAVAARARCSVEVVRTVRATV
jgi:nucleotide-binding universal stress UspA family protein